MDVYLNFIGSFPRIISLPHIHPPIGLFVLQEVLTNQLCVANDVYATIISFVVVKVFYVPVFEPFIKDLMF